MATKPSGRLGRRMGLSGFILAQIVTAFLLIAGSVGLAAESKEEGLLERLRGNDRQECARAALDLGRMGSAAGLEVILDIGNGDLYSPFAAGLQTQQKTELPEPVEAVIVRRFEDLQQPIPPRAYPEVKEPEGSPKKPVIFPRGYGRDYALTTLLGRLSYRSEPLFSRLRDELSRRLEQPHTFGRDDEPVAIIRLIVRTDLAIEKSLFELLERFPADPRRLLDYCPIIQLLGERKFEPALPKLEAMLAESVGAWDECLSDSLVMFGTGETISAVAGRLQSLRASGNARVADRLLTGALRAVSGLPERREVDFTALRRLVPQPIDDPGLARAYFNVIRKRRQPEGVVDLVTHVSGEGIDERIRTNALYALLEAGSREDWIKAKAGLDRRKEGGQITLDQHVQLAKMLDAKIDPEGHRSRESTAFEKAQELGRQGDAKGLEELIAGRDPRMIHGFGSGLRRNPDPYLPAAIEALVVKHFDDPTMGESMRGLVGRGAGGREKKYRSMELFERFEAALVHGSIRDPRDLPTLIVATDLPVEARLLELLAPSRPEGGGARAHVSTPCPLFEALASRGYELAVTVMEQALLGGGRWHGDRTSFCAGEALVDLGSEQSLSAVVRFLGGKPKDSGLLHYLVRKLSDLPSDAPLDFLAFRRLLGQPIESNHVENYVRIVRHRRERAGVPDLIALLSERAAGAALYEPAFHALVGFDSEEVWTLTRKEIERLYKEGRIGRWSYEQARSELDALLADSEKALAKRRQQRPHPAVKQLSEWDEERLLGELAKNQDQSARDVAKALGGKGSEKGFELLIQRRDVSLLEAFAEGTPYEKRRLTPKMEMLVYEHLDDREIFYPLYNLVIRTNYQDRRIFDRLKKRILSPEIDRRSRGVVAGMITKTELPIEEEVVKLLGRLPQGPSEFFTRCPLIRFLGDRGHAGAVRPLSEALRTADPQMSSCISSALVKIGTPEAVGAVANRVRELRTDLATANIASMIATEALQVAKDLPAATREEFLTARKSREPPSQPDPAELEEEQKLLSKGNQILERLRDEDPEKHAKAYEQYLDALAARVRQADADAKGSEDEDRTRLPWQQARYQLAFGYLGLGDLVRFIRKEPRRALVVYEKARGAGLSQHVPLLIELALADTWQFDLGDGKEAVKHLRAANDEVSVTVGRMPGNGNDEGIGGVFGGWISKWIDEEIRFLEKGKPFHGRISREAASGIGMFMFLIAGQRTMLLQSTLLKGIVVHEDPFGAPPVDRETLVSTLRQLPASHVILTSTIHVLPHLPAEEILRYLARQDPGRYLTAVTLATAALEDHERELGREVRDYSVMPKPKPGEPYEPSPLRVAAERFFANSGIQVDAPPFKPVIALSPEDLDKHLKEVWKQFRQALIDGNIEEALSHVTISERKKHRAVFEALLSKKADFGEILGEKVQRVEMYDDWAEYATTRVTNGEALVFMVRFREDIDGTWRVDTL